MKPIILIILFLSFSSYGQVNGRYLFERNDSIAVLEAGDSLEHPWAGGLNAFQVSKIDLNNDNVLDLFLFDRSGDKIVTFLRDTIINDWVYAPEYEDDFPDIYYWAILSCLLYTSDAADD